MSPDVAIVGAGIFGLSAALELSRRGMRVALIDSGTPPAERASSTDISKLIRADYGADVFYTGLMEQALVGWRELAAEQKGLFFESGMLVLSRSPLAPGSFEGDSYQLLISRGHRLERLSQGDLRDRAPVFSAEHFVEGYVNPQGGYADSGRVVRHLTARAKDAGVDLHTRRSILPFADGAVDGIRFEDGSRLSSGNVVLCPGAALPYLLPELSNRVRPIAQTVLHFAPHEPERFSTPHFLPWAADIANTGWYGFPHHQDVLKIAHHGPGTHVDVRAERVPDPTAEARFRAFLEKAMPSVARAPLAASKVCLYADTFDGDFLIDRHPERPNLIIAGGGSGHAFKFAPVLGQIIADRVTIGAAAAADRFRFRDLGERRFEHARCSSSSAS